MTFLGTGTPSLDPARYGAATLVEAGDRRLLFDVGRGATIRLRQAGLAPIDVDAVFLTHFHSDHVVGLPDLFLSRIILDAGRPGSNSPLRLFGPPGTGALADGLRQAFAADLAIRRKDERSPEARMQIRVVEMDEGVVFDEDGLRVTMFRVDHGEDIRPAVGYRIDFRGRSVVLSGDTRYDPSIADRAKGVDLLVHETAVADEMIAATPRFSRILAHHTSPQDVGRIFASAAPKLAAVSHIGMHGAVDETDIAEGVRTSYHGPLLIAQDLTRVLVGQGDPVVTRAGDR
ncbi:MBL fold metallo-hydrolase [Tsuneonella sp. YG55]|uniref:MBL fold metallo-hydrolase n=1 Tax=Tsuneonella litorea TaxID=2976475 RepID=A0A9X2VZ56_9SPHN|nr:MBL fold metallo-hydrolase [Tsuneonella litorea]MCT2558042.1 MBL fold metallo-hydrolase [Tsuneonella litorea]